VSLWSRSGASYRIIQSALIPKEKAKTFARRLIEALSGNHEVAAVDM